MRLVTYMNEMYFKEMINELESSFQDLAWKFDHYSPNDYPRPQRLQEGENLFPFPLAAELYHIYQYLAGAEEAPDTMYETLQSVCALVWHNPFVNASSYNIEWELWEKTKLGQFVRCSFVAIQLAAGEAVNSKQLSMMTGLSIPGVVKNIKSGNILAAKEGREWVIQPEDAIRFINDQTISQRKR